MSDIGNARESHAFHGDGSYLEWPTVFAGAAVAVAITLVLAPFGAALGFAVGEPLLENQTVSWNVLVAGLWALLMAFASTAAGGYLAGRMRRPWPDASAEETEFRDGVHGLVVWAAATIVVVMTMSVLPSLAGKLSAARMATDGIGASETYTRIAGNIAVIYAFASAAGAVLAAGAGWWFATLGGDHRTKGVDMHLVVPAFLRKRTPGKSSTTR